MKKLIFFTLALMLMPMAFADYNSTLTDLWAKYKFNLSDPLIDSINNYEPLVNDSPTPTFVSGGIVGERAYFVGGYGHSLLNYNETYFKPNSFSVNAWVYPNTFPDVNVGIIDNTGYSGGAWYGFGFALRGNGSLVTRIWTGLSDPHSTDYYAGTTALTGRWIMATLVVDVDNDWLAMYINASIVGNHTLTQDPVYNYTQGFCFGGCARQPYDLSACGLTYFNGYQDEIAIWDRAITSGEIQFIYDTEAAGVGFESNLVEQLPAPIQQITIISPDNHATSNQMLDVAYNITIDGSCSLYIDGMINQTDAAVENSTTQYFNVTDMLTDGTYDYYINCTGDLSEERHYHLHADSPLIDMFQPNHDNSTIFTTFNLTWIGNITNDNLTYVNETIRNGTSDIVYSDETITATTFLDLAKSIDATAWGNGYYYYYIFANDELDNPSEEYISFQIDVCIPAWVCSAYDACFANDTQACNAVTDTNVCGEAYGGDYSEFPAQSCNYCTAAATATLTNLGNTTCQYDLLMTNWAACCNATQLESDCLYTFTTPAVTANFTLTDSLTEYVSCTGYFGTYGAGDLDDILADALGTTGAVFVAFIGLIVLVLIGVWAYRKVKGR